MVTKNQVKQWLDSHNHVWVDFDNAYGAQCMDLSVKYAMDLFGFRLTGNAENLRNQSLPAGWQRIKNSNGFVPQLGDIFVWYGSAHPYGHTGIVISADLNQYTALEQNMVTGKGLPEDRAEIHSRAYPADFWGVVRPPISDSPDNSNQSNDSEEVDDIKGYIHIRIDPKSKKMFLIIGDTYQYIENEAQLKIHESVYGKLTRVEMYEAELVRGYNKRGK